MHLGQKSGFVFWDFLDSSPRDRQHHVGDGSPDEHGHSPQSSGKHRTTNRHSVPPGRKRVAHSVSRIEPVRIERVLYAASSGAAEVRLAKRTGSSGGRTDSTFQPSRNSIAPP